MFNLLAQFGAWLLSALQVKFVAGTILLFLVGALIATLSNYLSPYVGLTALTSAFADANPGVWYFLNLFHVPAGVGMLLSAYVTRFLVRRLPVIG